MQLGMIGLGRMGANMVRRLMRNGHECVVYDRSADAVKELAGEGAIGAASLDEFVGKLTTPKAVWLMLPAAVVDASLKDLDARLQPGDIVIDGGNSYYIDDIRRAKELAAKGHPVCRRRHERRRVGSGSRLLHDDRRAERCRAASRSDFQDAGAGTRQDRSDAGPRKTRRHGGRGLPALRAERRRALRQDGAQRHRVRHHGRLCGRLEYSQARQRGQSRASRPSAETTPLRNPEDYQYDLNLADIAEVWRRGSVIASWLLDLTRDFPGRRSGARAICGPRVRFGRRPLDDSRRDR